MPGLSGTFTDDDDVPVSLSGYDITLHIAYPEPIVVPGTVTDAANGKYVIQWRENDLVAGRWRFEVQFASPSGGVQTVNRHPETREFLELVIDKEVA